LLLLTALAGCETPPPVRPTPHGWTSTEELAWQEGLTVTKRMSDREVLSDGRNVVVVFPSPGGRVYVNGRPIGPRGSAQRVAARIWITDEVVPDIVAALLPPPEPRPARPPAPERDRPAREAAAIPPSDPAPRRRVVLDPGHGGRDPGAIGLNGTREDDVNLALALRLAAKLRAAGVEVHLTRDDDTFVELSERAKAGNRRRADLFVSLHADAARNRKAHGYTLYVRRGATEASRRAARSIEAALRATGLSSRGVREANFVVLRESKGAAVLVEAGFLTNPVEERRLRDPGFRERMATALARGIRGSW
jgi:N-acetylmuramoyl-L-alanine amidase